MDKDYLLLKWGTVKGWDMHTPECLELMASYMENAPLGGANDQPDERRKSILYDIIDKMEGDIWSDWTGVQFTKDEAKNYIRDYGKPNESPSNAR